jgi:hypothetical protein
MHVCIVEAGGVRRSEREKKKKASNQLGLRRKVSPQKGKPFNHPLFFFFSSSHSYYHIPLLFYLDLSFTYFVH